MHYVAIYYQKGQFHQIIEEGIQKKEEMEKIRKRPGVVDVVPIKKGESYELIQEEKEKIVGKIKAFYGNDKGLYQNAVNLVTYSYSSILPFDIFFDDEFLHIGYPDRNVNLTLHKDGTYVFTYECDVIMGGKKERQPGKIAGVVNQDTESWMAPEELGIMMLNCARHHIYLNEDRVFIELRTHWR